MKTDKYFDSTVQTDEDRQQKYHFCRLLFAVNFMLNLSIMGSFRHELPRSCHMQGGVLAGYKVKFSKREEGLRYEERHYFSSKRDRHRKTEFASIRSPHVGYSNLAWHVFVHSMAGTCWMVFNSVKMLKKCSLLN